MHGEIALESALDSGTKATFSIPFNKSQFPSSAPLVDIGALPNHVQSEMSVSACASDDRSIRSGPQSPLDTPSQHQTSRMRLSGSHGVQTPPYTIDSDAEDLQKIDRKNTHILVVEDKYVVSHSCVEIPTLLTLFVAQSTNRLLLRRSRSSASQSMQSGTGKKRWTISSQNHHQPTPDPTSS